MKNLLGTVPVFNAPGTKEASRRWVERETWQSVVTTKSATPWEAPELGWPFRGIPHGERSRASVTPAGKMCAASGKGGRLGQSNMALFLLGQFRKSGAR